MLRVFIFTICMAVSMFAKHSIKDENIQILAEKLDVKNDIINASGKVIVYSPEYYITAKRLVYDKLNAKLELFGDVNIVKNNEIVNFSQYIFIDIKNDINSFKPMLTLDNSNQLWFNAENGIQDKDNFDLNNSTLSSCDCEDPTWSIGFSSGDYNTTKQWINTYNTTLYIKDFPVFYTPYFGFPTDNTRRTGLLIPTIGYSQSQGFEYAQPIYYAPQDNYDIEYIPQVRTNRGYGHTLKYRYADSLYSNLKLETAIFSEKKSYQKEKNLTNREHYGWNLEYKRSKLFSTKDDTDGFLLDIVEMNDVDYISTTHNSFSKDETDKFLESQMKYFYNTNKYYGDIEANVYNDISKDNNDDTLQKVPSINLHKYSDSIFNNYLTTSIDINTNRQRRKKGLDADTTELYIPINFHTYLFDEYLNFSFTEEINYSHVRYNNSNYNDANVGENNHVFSLYTDLVKPYEDVIHAINFNTVFTNSNRFFEKGDLYSSNDKDTSELSPFGVSKTTQGITIGMNQSIYNKLTLKEIINHKLNQSYVYNNSTNSYEKNSLQNDLRYNYDYGYISNRLIYSYLIRGISSSSSTLNFTKDDYSANIYYTYLKDEDTLERDETIKYDLGFSFGKYYKLSYKEEFDLESNNSKKREYVFNIDDRCWAVNFRFIDSLVASDTTTDEGSYRQKILYMEFNLKQLFQINQKYDVAKRD